MDVVVAVRHPRRVVVVVFERVPPSAAAVVDGPCCLCPRGFWALLYLLVADECCCGTQEVAGSTADTAVVMGAAVAVVEVDAQLVVDVQL